MVFVELPIFVRCAQELFSDDDLHELQLTLLENPVAVFASCVRRCRGEENAVERE